MAVPHPGTGLVRAITSLREEAAPVLVEGLESVRPSSIVCGLTEIIRVFSGLSVAS